MKARPYCSCCLQTKPAFGHCRVLAGAVIAQLLLASLASATIEGHFTLHTTE